MSQDVINSLVAQLEASKQMYNEALNNLFNVRTSNVMLQQQVQKHLQEIQDLKNVAPVAEVPVEEPKPLE